MYDFDPHNLLLMTDSYKASHWLQYPPNTEAIYEYVESRGGVFDEVLFFGLQAYIKQYLLKPITQQNIDEAETFWKLHGEPFNKEGWQYILDKHNGYLPIRITAVPEGTVVPVKNVMTTIESTDPMCYWLPSHVETGFLRAIWYGSTVATISWSIKQVLRNALEKTASEEAMPALWFMLHDFGGRGVSSHESAGIGGAAHLVNFAGSDTVEGALYAMHYYGYEGEDGVPSFSIPAAEHSSITSWGRDKEFEAYRNMLKQFKGYHHVAVVSDSYDIFHAVKEGWGGELKDEVIGFGGTIVVRPDSGEPHQVVLRVLELLAEKYGTTRNEKGYKVLPPCIRVIQGDGIEEKSIRLILRTFIEAGFSAENVVYGMGGALLQKVDRDTQKFACKAAAAKIDGKWVDVFKDPITDQGKGSKHGRQMLYRDKNGQFFTGREAHGAEAEYDISLELVYLNGQLKRDQTFNEIRDIAETFERR